MWPFRKKVSEMPMRQTPHHYVLAHIALRQAAEHDPYAFFAVMAGPQRQKVLESLWRQVCRNCDKDGAATFTAGDIKVIPIRIGEYPALMVEMPPAHHAAEAHMVCIVLRVPVAELSRKPEKPQIAYFTLEKGVHFPAGTDRTVLCSWTDGMHNNHGTGPARTCAAFAKAVGQLVSF